MKSPDAFVREFLISAKIAMFFPDNRNRRGHSGLGTEECWSRQKRDGGEGEENRFTHGCGLMGRIRQAETIAVSGKGRGMSS